MRVERSVKNPGLWLLGHCLMERTYEWRVVLNKRERATLKRAKEIVEQMRELAAGEGKFGVDELWDEPGGYELSCAEAYLGEVASYEFMALTPTAIEEVETMGVSNG